MSDQSKKQMLCPSAECQDGAILLGIVQRDQTVSFLSTTLIINQEFVQISKLGRSPKKRFRFSNSCIKYSCNQWIGERCGVIDKLTEIVGKEKKADPLPSCSIREECRWFEQCGSAACSICPQIVTDIN